MHCVLINSKTDADESQIPPSKPDQPSAQRLMGNIVASPCVAQDENGSTGTFFVFPDLSCRSPGKYRLLFRMLRIDPLNIMQRSHEISALVTSDVFEVFTAKEFPGMRASSALLRSLRMQGLSVGVKKGSEASKRNAKKAKQTESNSEGESEDEDEDGDHRYEEGTARVKRDEGATTTTAAAVGGSAPVAGEAGPSRPKSKAKRIRSK